MEQNYINLVLLLLTYGMISAILLGISALMVSRISMYRPINKK